MNDKPRPTQLTIDGGEVRHPPPPPKVTCPECGKLITLTAEDNLRHHSNGWGEDCPLARRPYRTGL